MLFFFIIDAMIIAAVDTMPAPRYAATPALSAMRAILRQDAAATPRHYLRCYMFAAYSARCAQMRRVRQRCGVKDDSEERRACGAQRQLYALQHARLFAIR